MMMHAYYLSQWVLFFFIYSFIGWVWESCYVSVRKRRWVNRGFMHGPMLPLYGSGALVILIVTIPVRENLILVFLVGMAGATILEYFTGAAMERLFHVRYWDYSRQPGNLNGHICPMASLCWGFFSVLMVRFIHVPVENAVLRIPLTVSEGLATVLTVAAAVDFTQSFNEAMDMKNILVQLEESKKQIRQMQEKLKTASGEVLEDYRRYSEQLHQKSLSRRNVFIEQIHAKREQQRKMLLDLSERAEMLLREELPAKVDELIGEERREELAELKSSILQELQKLGARTDKRYLRAAGQLRRNPTAVSERFKETMEELRRLMDADQRRDREMQDKGEDK